MVARGAKTLRKTQDSWDVLILGGGPAGLALGGACGRRGLSTLVIDPHLGTAWDRSFGSFYSDLIGLDVEPAILRSFARPLVRTDDDGVFALRSSYSRFDTGLLQSLLLERAEAAGAHLAHGTAREVSFDSGTGRTVCTATMAPGPGSPLASENELAVMSAGVVVNSTGGATRFDGSSGRRPPAYQSAYGQWIQVREHPYGADEMSLMDYRQLPSGGDATFLYALPESWSETGSQTLFVQETSLISAKPHKMGELSRRLSERLQLLGIQDGQVLGTERCLIPMGGRLPPCSSLTLPYGASAGFVHPATGYQIARALRLAAPVAEVLAGELNKGPLTATREALALMWPSEARRAWTLFEHAAEILATLSPQETRQFIHAFFCLESRYWARFMSGTMNSREIAETMWRLFAEAPPALRARLIRSGSRVATSALIRPFS